MKLSTLLVCAVVTVSLAFPALAAPNELEAGLNSLQVGYEIYQVQPGDTVENIAVRFGVSAQRLRLLNRIEEDAEVSPGQSLAILLPGRARPRTELAPDASGPSVDLAPAASAPASVATSFSPRYAVVSRACTIASARPPASARSLWQCEPGDRVLVSSEQEGYYGVIMLGGATGWLPTSAAQVTDSCVTPDQINRMLQQGQGHGEVVQEAMRYLGTPYRYGGALPRDVDCSLLVQTVFARYGVHMPRTAAEQCEIGTPVTTDQLQPGDRLYFINHAGRINHTAIYMGDSQFIHASSNRGCVAINSLTEPYYAARFYCARRLRPCWERRLPACRSRRRRLVRLPDEHPSGTMPAARTRPCVRSGGTPCSN